ncbi:LysR substrate-binding domain-containing protein [Archangium violaceum]|uniref:LysR substrate-binding domain-containing protein n=1 Tax=Archangium violaceum TaxID=83451 RepID=UPI0037BEF32E
MVKHAAMMLVRPMLPRFLAAYPDIQVEIDIDDGFTDIVANRFDAGIRLGERLEKDMIAVRVGPDLRFAVVASPAYLKSRSVPRHPRDLAEHRCINYRLASAGALYAWRFEKHRRRLDVRVNGPLVYNDGDMILAAAVDGLGIAYLFSALSQYSESGEGPGRSSLSTRMREVVGPGQTPPGPLWESQAAGSIPAASKQTCTLTRTPVGCTRSYGEHAWLRLFSPAATDTRTSTAGRRWTTCSRTLKASPP